MLVILTSFSVLSLLGVQPHEQEHRSLSLLKLSKSKCGLRHCLALGQPLILVSSLSGKIVINSLP